MKLATFFPFILAGLSFVKSAALECALADPVALDKDGLVTLQQYVDQERGIMTMKVHYTGGRSYIGIGVNEAGQALMTPSTVVMGFGSDEGTTMPMTFSLTSKEYDGSGLNPTDSQTLQNATFEQTEDTSTLTFSQSIANFGGGSPINDDSQWIFAIGSPDNGPGHPIYGTFKLALNTCGSDPSDVKLILPTASKECILADPVALDKDGFVTLQQYVDQERGIMTMKVHYAGGRSYIGIGVNEAGQALMTPSTVVMGFGSDEGTTMPMTFSLTSKEYDGSGLNPTDSQTLQNATFEQTEDTSTLTFSQSIANFGGGSPINDDSQWIFAIGSPDNGPGHPIYGTFKLALNPCGSDPSDVKLILAADEADDEKGSPAVDEVEQPEAGLLTSSAAANVECALTEPIALDDDGLVTLQQYVDTVGGFMTMKVHYSGGQSWVGIGINEAGQTLMVPGTVVIGFASENGTATTTPLTYSLTTKAFDGSGVNPTASQTLQRATFEQTEETSTLTFSQSIADFGGGSPITDNSQWIFAIGSPDNGAGHPIYGSFQLSLYPCGADPSAAQSSLVVDEIEHPERKLWIAHGVLLALAWGVCSPIAIGASVVREGFDRLGFPKGTWYKVHFYMNSLCALFTIIGFILAVVATNNEEGAIHWSSKHHKIGLTIFILAVLQAAGGVGRPGLPHPKPKPVDEKTHNSDDNMESDTSNTDDSEEEAPKKSVVRVGWEWGHRIVGLGVLGMAWSNCHTGIDWITRNFPDLEKSAWMGAFWGVTGGIAALVIVLGVGLRMTSNPPEVAKKGEAPTKRPTPAMDVVPQELVEVEA